MSVSGPEPRAVALETNTLPLKSLLLGSPQADPESWNKTADWIISGNETGFTLENAANSEYLYAEDDQFSVSEYQRSVITSGFNETSDLPDSAQWTFSKSVTGSGLFYFWMGSCWVSFEALLANFCSRQYFNVEAYIQVFYDRFRECSTATAHLGTSCLS